MKLPTLCGAGCQAAAGGVLRAKTQDGGGKAYKSGPGGFSYPVASGQQLRGRKGAGERASRNERRKQGLEN